VSRIRTLILVLTLVAACGKGDSVQNDAQDAASSALTTALRDSLAVADQLITQGKNSEPDLQKQLAVLDGARVDQRLPKGAVDGAALKKVLNAYSRMHGLGAVELKLGKAPAGAAVPVTHVGEAPYPYEAAQLIGTAPIAITVHGNDPERLQAFYEAMGKLQVPFMMLPTLMVGTARSTFSGSVYFRHPITPPARAYETPPLDRFAAKLKVALPADPAQLKALSSLHAQLVAKAPAVLEALKKQDQVSQQARLLQFLRKQAKSSAALQAPKTITAPDTGTEGKPTPTPPTGKAP